MQETDHESLGPTMLFLPLQNNNPKDFTLKMQEQFYKSLKGTVNTGISHTYLFPQSPMAKW